MRCLKIFLLTCFSFLIFVSSSSSLWAQELVIDKEEVVRAEVLEILKQEERVVPGLDASSSLQTLSVKILEGSQRGEIVTIENDFTPLKQGQNFFLYHSVDGLDGREMYSVKDVDRRNIIFFFVGLFVLVVLIFSGKQGLRSLISLLGSFFVILYMLIPGLLAGYPPVLTSIVIATIILFLAIYFTHGFNRVSTVAFIGTVLAVAFTGMLAYIGVTLANFTGLVTEEAFYLNLNTKGVLNLSGLLLGGIMIGVLGVLDDIAITQSAVVSEFYSSASHLSRKEIYKKALHIGKEHVGALVNTLALAYTGASLPLLLLFSTSDSSFANIINQEIFATEIIRTTVGSIGLILTVPITTLLAVHLLKDYKGKNSGHSHLHNGDI